jgi:hypothetical protein
VAVLAVALVILIALLVVAPLFVTLCKVLVFEIVIVPVLELTERSAPAVKV